MRSDLEANRGRGLILTGSKLGTFRKQLTGDISLSKDSTNNLLDANGADRTVTLPNVDAGVFMVISNTGAAFNLILKNPDASQILTLTPGDSTWLVGNANKWYAVAGVNDVFGPSGPNHKVGLVPDPGAVPGTTRVLKEDGTWGTFAAVANDSYAHITNGVVSTNASGLDTFKIRSSSGKIGITVQENDVTHGDNADFTVVEAAVDHNALLNFVANKHIDHSAVSINAGEGLSGGGDLTVSRTFALAFAGLVAATPVLGDTLAFYDLSATAHRKMLISELNSVLAHDSLAGFVANKHIDHSLVFMIAGAGLSGGGDITATRTFSLDINSLTAQATMGANDYLAFYDVGGADHNKLTLSQLATSLTGIGFGGGGGGGTPGGSAGQVQYNTGAVFGGASALIWDDVNFRVYLGHTASINIAVNTHRLQVTGATSGSSSISTARFSADTGGSMFSTGKSRGASLGTHAIVLDGDNLGVFNFSGDDGANFIIGAQVTAAVEGTPAANNMPGVLKFWTNPGQFNPVERMRINHNGNVTIGQNGSMVMPDIDFSPVQFGTVHVNNGNWGYAQLMSGAHGAHAGMVYAKTRNVDPTLHTIVNDGDRLFDMRMYASDGTAYKPAARTEVMVDGAPALNSIPGRFVWYTNPVGGTSPAERMRLDSAGRLVIGGVASQAIPDEMALQIHGLAFATAGASFVRWTNSAASVSSLTLAKSRGATVGAHAIVVADDVIGRIVFRADDGAAFQDGAYIAANVDGTPGLGDMPTRLSFHTTPDAAAFPVERLRITNGGQTVVGGGAAQILGNGGGGTPTLQVNATSLAGAWAGLSRWANNSQPVFFTFSRSRGAAVGTHAISALNDDIAYIGFAGDDGVAFQETAVIKASVDAAPGLNSLSGRLTFWTTNAGTAAAERMRIDNAGMIFVNITSTETVGGSHARFVVAEDSNAKWVARFAGYNNVAYGPEMMFTKTRGASAYAQSLVGADDTVGGFNYYASDGTAWRQAARIYVFVDGAPGANSMPGRIAFFTTPSGFASASERLRIDNAGRISSGGVAAHADWGPAVNPYVQFNAPASALGTARYSFDNLPNRFTIAKSTSNTVGTQATVANGDGIGAIIFAGSDGAAFIEGAKIDATIENTVGLNDMPTRLAFHTTPDGTAAAVERLRIDSNGIAILQDAVTASGAIATYAGNLTPKLQIHSTSIESLAVTRWNAGSNGPKMFLAHSGAGVGAYDTLGVGAMVGEFVFAYPGSTGTTFNMSSVIRAIVDVASVGSLDTPSALTFMTQTPNGSLLERLRIDSNGRMTNRGGTVPTTLFGSTSGLALDMAKGPLSLQKFSADGGGPWITADKSRNATYGSHTVVNDNDDLLGIYASGSTGTVFSNAATILMRVDGTPPGTGVPGRIMFLTTLSGNASPSERVRIDNSGAMWLMGSIAPVATPTNAVGNVNETVSLFNHEALGGI